MKLKTLKDFIKPLQKCVKDNEKDKTIEGITLWTGAFYSIDTLVKLKKEAIKWVKELKRIEKRDYGWYCPRCEVGWHDKEKNYCWDCELKANILIDFFNITEEDLE